MSASKQALSRKQQQEIGHVPRFLFLQAHTIETKSRCSQSTYSTRFTLYRQSSQCFFSYTSSSILCCYGFLLKRLLVVLTIIATHFSDLYSTQRVSTVNLEPFKFHNFNVACYIKKKSSGKQGYFFWILLFLFLLASTNLKWTLCLSLCKINLVFLKLPFN